MLSAIAPSTLAAIEAASKPVFSDSDSEDYCDADSSPPQPRGVPEVMAHILADAASIITAVTEGKSVTSANKKRIVDLAKSIMDSTKTLSSSCQAAAVRGPAEASVDVASLRDEIGKIIKEEIGKALPERPIPVDPTISYANVARATPTKSVERPVSKPALIVSAKENLNSKEEMLQAWRKSITYRNSNYAPAKVQHVSNNKIRVEFDCAEHQADTLNRLSEPNSQVMAEPAKRLRPMVELKGIYEETPINELIDIIKQQNESFTSLSLDDGDIVFKFQRRNKNPTLYNAVLMVTPTIWHKMMQLGFINIDHQRVNVSEFVPLLQCFKCLQYGHTLKRCTSESTACSHCGGNNHCFSKCAQKEKKTPTCFNCTEHNHKYGTSKRVDHGATSQSCPIHTTMKNKLVLRIDYGL